MSLAIKSALAALILGGAAFDPSALAQTSGEPGSVRIAYGDLNMSAVDGGESLLVRIRSAAGKACNQVVPHSLLSPRALTLCRRDAVEQTVRDMNMPTLTAALTGERPTTILASR